MRNTGKRRQIAPPRLLPVSFFFFPSRIGAFDTGQKRPESSSAFGAARRIANRGFSRTTCALTAMNGRCALDDRTGAHAQSVGETLSGLANGAARGNLAAVVHA
jgi:hypothetical protein